MTPIGELVVNNTTVHAAGMGQSFTGVRMSDVQVDARLRTVKFLETFPAHIAQGHGLAFTGAQGTGKTAILALIAEASIQTIPMPEYQPMGESRKRVRYVRMPWLCRQLSDFLPASEKAGWTQQYETLCSCNVLLIDEAHVVPHDDRATSMLLDLIDRRVSECRPVFLAMNARWDDLRNYDSALLRQIREKLSAVVREVVIPGESRRKAWEV
jgi:DNA replication protein DnaC